MLRLLWDLPRQGDDQTPGELCRRGREQGRTADQDSAFGGCADVYGHIEHARGHQKLEFGQPFEKRARKTGALAHGHDHLEIAEVLREAIVTAEPFVERVDAHLRAEALPISH